MIRATVALGALGTTAVFAQTPETATAAEIMRRSLETLRPRSSKYQATLTLKSPTGADRIRQITGSTLRLNSSSYARTVRFDSPADIKGTSTLMIQHEGAEDDLWVYLPALKKVRRLLSSNRRDSYVGTEFSFGDIAGLRIEDWTHSFRPEVTLGGAPCWLIESIAASAKVSAETGYSRMMTTVRKDNLVQVQIDYFDTAGRALKTGVMSDLREVDAAEHRWQAMRLEMTNATNKRSSSIQFGEYKVNVAVPASSFTSAALEG